MSKAGWRAVTPDSDGNFSPVGYFFGRGLHQRCHVPIGMIESNWSGTVAEAWMSAESLKSFPEFNEEIETVRRTDDKTAVADFDRYRQEKVAWYEQHSADAGIYRSRNTGRL